MLPGARASVKPKCGVNGGESAATVSKPLCNARVPMREERKAREEKSFAWAMPKPSLLYGAQAS